MGKVAENKELGEREILKRKMFILDDVFVRFILPIFLHKNNLIKKSDRPFYIDLFFELEQAHWFLLDHYNFRERNFIKFLLIMNKKYLKIEKKKLKRLLYEFIQYKNKIICCGCIIFNPSKTKVLLVKHFGSKHYFFPKGKINKNENYKHCAIREVYEETGFLLKKNQLRNYITIGKNRLYYCNLNKNQYLYSLFNLKPKTKGEISSIKWIKIKNIFQKNIISILNKLPQTCF